MKTIYVHYNDCYGGASLHLEREYDSIEEFNKAVKQLQKLSILEINEIYHGIHPLECSSPRLAKIQLADDEEWFIKEYDGNETIGIRKKQETSSVVTYL